MRVIVGVQSYSYPTVLSYSKLLLGKEKNSSAITPVVPLIVLDTCKISMAQVRVWNVIGRV